MGDGGDTVSGNAALKTIEVGGSETDRGLRHQTFVYIYL